RVVVVLYEGVPIGIPAALHDLLVDGISLADPAIQRRRSAAFGRETDRAVKRHPGHHPAVCEVFGTTAGLPDAGIRLVPIVRQPAEKIADREPTRLADLQATSIAVVDAVHRFTKDVKLQLLGRAVADTHRIGMAITLPMLENLFGEVT